MNAFRNSVYSAIRANENYRGLTNNPVNIINVEENIDLLPLNNREMFTRGLITYNNGVIRVLYITDGRFCAMGVLRNLEVFRGDCTDQLTPPVITNVEATIRTTNAITVEVTAHDEDFEIVKYFYSRDNGATFVEHSGPEFTFTGLQENVEYDISVRVENSLGIGSEEYRIKASTISGVYGFYYTGNPQTFTIPVAGIYEIEVRGAQGGNNGGAGGLAIGRISLTAGTVLTINVGGQGTSDTGGWNGGGAGAFGGGGATNIVRNSNGLELIRAGGGGARTPAGGTNNETAWLGGNNNSAGGTGPGGAGTDGTNGGGGGSGRPHFSCPLGGRLSGTECVAPGLWSVTLHGLGCHSTEALCRAQAQPRCDTWAGGIGYTASPVCSFRGQGCNNTWGGMTGCMWRGNYTATASHGHSGNGGLNNIGAGVTSITNQNGERQGHGVAIIRFIE